MLLWYALQNINIAENTALLDEIDVLNIMNTPQMNDGLVDNIVSCTAETLFGTNGLAILQAVAAG